MNSQSLRWPSEGSADLWRGYHRGAEVAEVWPGAFVGNLISGWHWKLLSFSDSENLAATGDEDRDRYAAQSAASRAYFSHLG